MYAKIQENTGTLQSWLFCSTHIVWFSDSVPYVSTILSYSEQVESEGKEAAKILCCMLKQWIHEEGYTLNPNFNIHENVLYQKWMPSKTYIAKKEVYEPQASYIHLCHYFY